MIIVKNRELLIPPNERYLGTNYDDRAEIRVFSIKRVNQGGVDISHLTFRLDLKFPDGTVTNQNTANPNEYTSVFLQKERVTEDTIILQWTVAKALLQVPGTLFIQIRATDDNATIRWSSYVGAMYVERHLNTPTNYTGDLTEIEQMEQDHEYMKGVIDELVPLLDYTDDAEAWAKGTRHNGTPVDSDDPTYHNNSKYYAESSMYAAADSEGFRNVSQAYAEGKIGSQDVDSDDPAYHNNAKYYAEQAGNHEIAADGYAEDAQGYANDASKWARGKTAAGTDVGSSDPAYHNNAKYYAEQAGNHEIAADGYAEDASVSAGQASAAMLAAQNARNDARAAADTAAQGSADSSGYAQDSEAWAVGQRDGVDVDSSDPTYHNNSKYYKDQSTIWAGFASGSMLNSEAWAVGQKNGTDVPATAEQYHNNSKYYSEQAAAAATRAESAAESLTVDDALSDTSTNAVQNKVVTAELTDVKSAIYENPKIVASYISGSRGATGAVSANTKRCTSPSIWNLRAGDTVSFSGNASGQKYAFAGTDGTTVIFDSDWKTGDKTYTVSTDGKYFVNVATTSGQEDINPSAVTLIVTVTDNTSRIAVNQKDITDLDNVIKGLSVKSRNLLPVQPKAGVISTIDLGSEMTFENGVNLSFDATDVVLASASAAFIYFDTEAGEHAATVTLNSARNFETGLTMAAESSPHTGRYHTASIAATQNRITFRKIVIRYLPAYISSGVFSNFELNAGISPTPYIPHDAAKDYGIEQDANPLDLYAEVNKTSIMDVDYWDIKTNVITTAKGTINANAGGFTTRLFPAKEGDVLKYKFSAPNTIPILLIYDKDMQVIPEKTVIGTGNVYYKTGEYIFEPGECFFRFNGALTVIDNYILAYNDIPVAIKNYVKEYVENYAVRSRTFPEYWDTAVGNAVTAIKNQLLAMETGDCFFFVTDQHWTSNAQRSSSIIDYVSEKTGVYNVFIGGDVVSSNNASQVGAMTEMLDYLGSFKGKNVRLFSTLGNHDRNSVAQTDQTLWLSIAQQYNALIKPEEEWLDTNGTPLCNVYDNKSQKVRYIQFWYTADSGYSDDVATALVSAMTSAPNDYTIVLMSHAYWNGIDPAQAAVRYANLILDTMDTMTATVALWVCGHVHKDYTTVLTSTGGKSLRIMSTTTDSVGQHPTNPSLTAGTDTEQAFDVYCINTTARTINAIRVGAGESRSFTY